MSITKKHNHNTMHWRGKIIYILLTVVIIISSTLLLDGCSNYANQDISNYHIYVFGTVLCGDECKEILDYLHEKDIPFTYMESNMLVDATVAYYSSQFLSMLNNAVQPYSLEYPVVIILDDKYNIRAIISGVKDKEKLADLIYSSITLAVPSIWAKNGWYYLSNMFATQFGTLTQKFVTSPTITPISWEEAKNTASYLLTSTFTVPNTCPPRLKNGFVVFGTTHCPYTKAFIHFAIKDGYQVCFIDLNTSDEDTLYLFSRLVITTFHADPKQTGIPFVIAYKNNKPFAVWNGFKDRDTLNELMDIKVPYIINPQTNKIEPLTSTLSFKINDYIIQTLTTNDK